MIQKIKKSQRDLRKRVQIPFFGLIGSGLNEFDDMAVLTILNTANRSNKQQQRHKNHIFGPSHDHFILTKEKKNYRKSATDKEMSKYHIGQNFRWTKFFRHLFPPKLCLIICNIIPQGRCATKYIVTESSVGKSRSTRLMAL